MPFNLDVFLMNLRQPSDAKNDQSSAKIGKRGLEFTEKNRKEKKRVFD